MTPGTADTLSVRPSLPAAILLSLLFLIQLSWAHAEEDSVKVIGHSTVPDTLHPDVLRRVFLGRKILWNNDIKIHIAILKDKPTYRRFLRTHVRKTVAQYRYYWKIKVFSGAGRMPKFFISASDLIDYVNNTKGAIGFLPSTHATDKPIKVIKIGG